MSHLGVTPLKTFFAFVVVAFSMTSTAFAQLLVADRAGHQILRYDARTGDFMDVLVPFSPETNGGLLAPSAMEIVGDELFVTGLGFNNIVRYDLRTGALKGVFADPSTVPGLENIPSALHYREETNELWVSTLGEFFNSELILRLDVATGDLISTLGEGTGESGRTNMVVGPDDNVYVSSFASGDFFTGAVMQIDGETLEFADNPFAVNGFVAGASGLVFRDGADEGTYQLDVVGLFSGNVGRFDVTTTDEGLQVSGQSLIVPTGLVFPSAILDLDDETMLVTMIGNDDPGQGELRLGAVEQFNIATGERVGTFIDAGGPGDLQQPTAILLVPPQVPTCGPDGTVDLMGLPEGDLDASGDVGFADFIILSGNYLEEGDYGDGNVDCTGPINFADFVLLSANYGEGSAVAATVPEPHGGWMIMLAMAMGMVGRRTCTRK